MYKNLSATISWVIFSILLITMLFSGVVLAKGQFESAEEYGIKKFNQAPMLKEMIDDGELPSLEERLPADPVVVNPEEEMGQYGGTLNRVHASEAMSGWCRINYVEPFIRWNRKATGFLPNLVREWEWNQDTTQLTIHFVEGIKWSDGNNLTVDDFLFWWEDLALDDRISISPPMYTLTDGEPMKVTKIDDYTLKFNFSAPNPLFLKYLARGYYHSSWFVVPSHYLKQFHPEYNSSLSDEEVNKLQDHYDNRIQYPEMPTYTAWRTVKWEVGKRAVFERNPYYWKVDTEGNQLPYIDRVVSNKIEDPEMKILNIMEGSVDFAIINNIQNIPVLYQKQEEGNYHIKKWEAGDYAWPQISLGYNYSDPKWRELVHKQKFRQALSFAINREQINDIVFLNMGTPRQAAMHKGAPSLQTPEGKKVYEKWANSWANYNPEKAKKYLDEVGIVDKNGDEWRDYPNGDELKLIVDVTADNKVDLHVWDFIEQQWADVGLKTVVNPIPATALTERTENSESMIWNVTNGCAWDLISAGAVWAPVEQHDWALAPIYSLYYESGGKKGKKPPKDSAFERLQYLYDKAKKTINEEKRNEIILDAYRIHINEGPLMIGTVADHPQPVTINNKLMNVPDFGYLGSWDLSFPGATNPEQYFFKE